MESNGIFAKKAKLFINKKVEGFIAELSVGAVCHLI